MRHLNTLYVRSHQASVRHRRGSLLVSTPEGKQRVPLQAIDALVMLGGGQVTTQALEACVKSGVRVAALRRSGSVRFVVGPGTGGNVNLRLALYRIVTDRAQSLMLAKSIVAAKLQNSKRVLARWSRDAKDPAVNSSLASRSEQILNRVPRLSDAATSDHLRGIEGDAARVYFRGMREMRLFRKICGLEANFSFQQ